MIHHGRGMGTIHRRAGEAVSRTSARDAWTETADTYERKSLRSLGTPSSCSSFFDRATTRIALRPAPPNDAAAFPVKMNRGCFQILAGPFCRHYRINLSTTNRFVSPTIDREGRLILNLTQTVNVSRKVRARS